MHLLQVTMKARLGVLIPLLACGVASATPVTVRIDLQGPASEKTVIARIEARPSEQSSPEWTQTVQVPSALQAELRANTAYVITVGAKGFWGESRLVFVDGTRGTTAVGLSLWPTGTVTGRAIFPQGLETQPDIGCRFSFTPPGDQGESPRGELECPTEGSGFRCEVPAGTLDLRLRAEWFVSHFVWGAKVPRAGSLDLVALTFTRGGSVVGWVETTSGPPSPSTCRVELSPAQATVALTGEAARRTNGAILSTHPTERGFFHLAGLAPGSYMIRAFQAPYSPTTTGPILVVENVETEVKEPIILEPPGELTVRVQPPLDPQGRPWKVTLFRRLDDPFESERLPDGESDGSERWLFTDVPQGPYSLQVSDADGSNWVDTPLLMQQLVQEEEVTVPVIPVEGRLTLGGKPLAGVVVFGGVHGKVAIKVWTDDLGRFECTLPREGEWEVTVGSRNPQLKRDMGNVPIRKRPGKAVAEVTIEIPDTLVEGKVVDESGRSVARASVVARSLSTREPQTEIQTDRHGDFQFRGLGVGRTLLMASSEGLVSDATQLEVRSENPVRNTVLVLRGRKQLAGRVVSSSGGVIGAVVTVVPVGQPSPGSEAVTGIDGRFEVAIPSWASEANIVVMAVGYSWSANRVQVPPKENSLIVLRVQPLGGAITVRVPQPPNDPRRVTTVLEHNGVVVGFPTLIRWMGMNRVQPGEPLTIPALEPGSYRVCALPAPSAIQLAAGSLTRDAVCTESLILSPNGHALATVPILEPGE